MVTKLATITNANFVHSAAAPFTEILEPFSRTYIGETSIGHVPDINRFCSPEHRDIKEIPSMAQEPRSRSACVTLRGGLPCSMVRIITLPCQALAKQAPCPRFGNSQAVFSSSILTPVYCQCNALIIDQDALPTQPCGGQNHRKRLLVSPSAPAACRRHEFECRRHGSLSPAFLFGIGDNLCSSRLPAISFSAMLFITLQTRRNLRRSAVR